MVAVANVARNLIEKQGRTQIWVAKRMQDINPELKMDAIKINAVLNGNRKMTGDELLAFCMALEISPDEFLHPRLPKDKEVSQNGKREV